MRVLFVRNAQERFVRQDLTLLSQRHDVSDWYSPHRKLNPTKLYRRVRECDLVFGWFASWHTLFPILFSRLLSKPSLLVIGGYDVAAMPEIGYGHQRGGPTKWLSRLVMRLATRLVTFSRYAQKEAETNAGLPRERVPVVYLGVRDELGCLPRAPRARMALTVGNVHRVNLRRKGHEAFVRAAGLLPGTEFVLVGTWKGSAIEYLQSISTPNVTFTGWVDDTTLLDYYRRARTYVQVSSHEGFGMSLAEAMLAGCIPVVTRAGALPEVAGPCGIYVPTQEPALVAKAIQEASSLSEGTRAGVRQRVLDSFSVKERQAGLQQLISDLMSDSGRARP